MRLLQIVVLIIFLSSSPVVGQDSVNHVIEVHNNYFSEPDLRINPGDTVTFVWMEGAAFHNIAQVDSSSDIEYNGGFRSGDPQSAPFSWELPTDYTQAIGIHYYVCEPHIANGMKGKIIVGDVVDTAESGTSLASILISLAVIPTLVRKRVLRRSKPQQESFQPY
jgi:plastocyanin